MVGEDSRSVYNVDKIIVHKDYGEYSYSIMVSTKTVSGWVLI